MESIARRGLLLGGSALCGAMVAPAILRGEPQYRLKFANIMPADHPLNTRMAEAAKAINEQRMDRWKSRFSLRASSARTMTC
jgi:TRAP-type C4-dicarboxylate transport system substrate-binding protein